MAEPFEVKIKSILGGQSRDLYNGAPDQFAISLGIDPDIQLINTQANKTSGAIVPSAYASFDGAALNGDPMWIITNPVNELVYVITDSNRLLSYTSGLASETNIGGYAGASESGDGNGGAYYNDYIYMVTTTDISRYGPLSGAAAIATDYWVTTLGLTALGTGSYGNLRGVLRPIHPMHVHVDGKLYFCDYASGQGLIHFIRTDSAGTNDGSTYNALDLPFDYRPVDIESWGNDLAILAVRGTLSANIVQGKASLFLWDTVSDSFYRQIDIQDTVASALLNHNGRLFVFSGANRGVRISLYEGGYSLRTLALIQESGPPFPGAVTALGERVFFGGFTTYPVDSASVFAMGYKDIFSTAIHNIINTDSTQDNEQMVTSLAHVQQASGNDSALDDPLLVVGWGDNTVANGFGLDSKSNNAANPAEYRTLFYSVGQPFRIDEISFGLGEAVTTNHTLIVTIYYDDGGTTEALTTINSTNFSASQRRIRLKPGNANRGNNNFSLGFRWSGTRQLAVTLPITIKGTTFDEDNIE